MEDVKDMHTELVLITLASVALCKCMLMIKAKICKIQGQ